VSDPVTEALSELLPPPKVSRPALDILCVLDKHFKDTLPY
jgi:hypothetical protein